MSDPLGNAWEFPADVRCPKCSKPFLWASGVQRDRAPKAGDNTICSACGAIVTFMADMSVQPATPAEIAEALKPEVCRRAYQALLSLIELRSCTPGR